MQSCDFWPHSAGGPLKKNQRAKHCVKYFFINKDSIWCVYIGVYVWSGKSCFAQTRLTFAEESAAGFSEIHSTKDTKSPFFNPC